MVGVVYYKTFKLSDVSSEEPVKYHLEEGLRDNFKNPKIFKVEEGLFGNTYTADLVLDTSVFLDLDEGETVEEYEEEIEEYANYVDIYYKVTLPKKAVSHNADLVDGKTYTWNVEYGSSKDINYVFKTTSPWVYAIIIIVAIAIIAVAVLAIMKFIKNKKSNIQIPIQPATEPLAVDSANESNPGYMMPIAVEPKIERMVSEEETVVPEEKIAVEDENIAQQETIESEAMVETENPEELANQNSVSYDFGSALLKGLISSTNLYNRGMKLGPELRVLKNATMPAALLEMGFISNSSDAALLSQSPELFAQGIYNGILDYFDLPSNETPKN